MQSVIHTLNMALLTHFSRKILKNNINFENPIFYLKKYMVCVRCLSYKPMEYNGEKDPAPIFFNDEVQNLMKNLTRIDLTKVYRKRRLGDKISQPIIKFMTDKQLEEAMNEIKRKVDEFIQVPPILKLRKPIDRVLSKDPALQGLENSKFIFTDITFGVPNSKRLIVIRDPDGTLREADWDVRDRMSQIYFPVEHRDLKIPRMFQNDNFEKNLKRKEFEFILDRACLQFEPDDPNYQRVVTITYQYINDNNEFDSLRSTRHFGALTFFLAWNKIIDNLLLDLIEHSQIDEAYSLIQLYGKIHEIKFSGKKLEVVEEFVRKYATKRGALELAIQSFKEHEKQKEALEKGIQRAHGIS